MDRVEALEVVASGRLESFIGVAEGGELEFKAAHYSLDRPAGVFELAKDVAGFANATGGVIVIGVATQRDERSRRDIARRLGLFEEELIDCMQCRDLIRAKIYPEVEGVGVEWKAPANEQDRGIVFIDVPLQPESRKLFLVREPILEAEEVVGNAVGLFVRRGADVQPARIEDIYMYVRDGRNIDSRLDSIEVRLTGIERNLDGEPEVPVTDEIGRVERAIEDL